MRSCAVDVGMMIAILVTIALIVQGWFGLGIGIVAVLMAYGLYVSHRNQQKREKRQRAIRAEINWRMTQQQAEKNQNQQITLRIAAEQNKVYFILDSANNAVKIGVSQNPLQRMSELQTSSPNRLTMLASISGGYALEKKLHSRFRRHKLSGEWFRMNSEIDNYIQGIKAA